MPRRRRQSTKRQIRRRRIFAAIILAPIWVYALAALVGTLIPVNRSWREPQSGTLVYLVDNDVHADLILPVNAQGLDWAPLFPVDDFANPPTTTRWIAFGAGERGIYLDTPRWRDLKLSTALRAIAGGERVLHVERLAVVAPEARALRLRPEEYRRLWTAIRADLVLDRAGRPRRIDHPGYGPSDAFYLATGKISAIRTCNVWVSDKLRVAGVKTSLWSPSVFGLRWSGPPLRS